MWMEVRQEVRKERNLWMEGWKYVGWRKERKDGSVWKEDKMEICSRRQVGDLWQKRSLWRKEVCGRKEICEGRSLCKGEGSLHKEGRLCRKEVCKKKGGLWREHKEHTSIAKVTIILKTLTYNFLSFLFHLSTNDREIKIYEIPSNCPTLDWNNKHIKEINIFPSKIPHRKQQNSKIQPPKIIQKTRKKDPLWKGTSHYYNTQPLFTFQKSTLPILP